MGIPTAPIVTIAFKDLAYSNAAQRGMPHERICFTPHPVWGKSDAQMYAYLEGDDPVTHKPLMPEIISALTKPLTPDEEKSGTVIPRVGPQIFSGSHDELQDYYMNNGMTDFMPIILPTSEKVDAMLKSTSHSPDEQVGKMCPAKGAYPEWSYTVRNVAVNAVMAGCDPSYFPIVLAIAASELPSLSSSTNSFATAAIVNGPIRDKLNMNYGIGAMGPFAQPNATVGRAWTLVSKNCGSCGQPGQTYMGTYGNTCNYNNLIIPENEKASPWEPFHVQKGFKPDESVVSVFFGMDIRQGQNGPGLGIKPVPHYQEAFAFNFGTCAPLFGGLVVCDPLVAQGLVELGFKTKEPLLEWVWENSTISVKDAKTTLFGLRMAGPGADKLPDDARIRLFRNANSVNIVVVGGETNPYHMVANMSYRSSVSVDKWM